MIEIIKGTAIIKSGLRNECSKMIDEMNVGGYVLIDSNKRSVFRSTLDACVKNKKSTYKFRFRKHDGSKHTIQRI